MRMPTTRDGPARGLGLVMPLPVQVGPAGVEPATQELGVPPRTAAKPYFAWLYFQCRRRLACALSVAAGEGPLTGSARVAAGTADKPRPAKPVRFYRRRRRAVRLILPSSSCTAHGAAYR